MMSKEADLPSALSHAEFDRWVTVCWCTEHRTYQAEIMQDLFGTWLLKRSWGGIGSRRRQTMTQAVDYYDHAVKLLHEIASIRQKRGYVPVCSCDVSLM